MSESEREKERDRVQEKGRVRRIERSFQSFKGPCFIFYNLL